MFSLHNQIAIGTGTKLKQGRMALAFLRLKSCRTLQFGTFKITYYTYPYTDIRIEHRT